jgi:SAM-dependent methyltransferase
MDPRRALSFGSAAAEYDAARPSYPADAVRWAIGDARRVLDLGAGTGKLARVVLDLGLEAVAVEPDDEMRAFIPTESHAGTAEQIPLPDASVDAVVVGQAFHWFDAAKALPEMVRVLRPGGRIGLFWNLYDDRVDWVAALCDLVEAEARMSLSNALSRPPFDGSAYGTSQPQVLQVPHRQPMNRELLGTQLRSTSKFILMPETEREDLVSRAIGLAPEDDFEFPHVCDAWRATKS